MKKEDKILLLVVTLIFCAVTIIFKVIGYNWYDALILVIGLFIWIFNRLINRLKEEKEQIRRKIRFEVTDKTEIDKYKFLINNLYDNAKNKLKTPKKKMLLGTFIICIYISSISSLLINIINSYKFDYGTLKFLIGVGIFLLVSIIGYIACIPYFISKNQYVQIYKEEIIKKFIEKITASMKFSLEITQDKKEKILKSYQNLNFDNYENGIIDDYISGYINGTYFTEFADIKLYRNDNVKLAKNEIEKVSREFERVFITIDISKYSSSGIKILNKSTLSDMKESVIFSCSNNQKFNEYFKLIIEDETESYLTDDLLNLIANYREKYEIEFDIIMKDKIYMRFFIEDIFEPKNLGSVVDYTSFYKYYIINKFLEEFIATINK